jgi:hypothetical protein
MSITVPISSAPWIPLSAAYPYDDTISFQPELYQFDAGYSLFHHPVMVDTKDVKAGSDTLFHLTTTQSFADIMDDSSNADGKELVIFTALQAANGKYLTTSDDILYATSDTIGPNEFFKLVKNVDSTFSIFQGGRSVTVNRNSPWELSIQDTISVDEFNTQQFNLYYSNDNITIRTNYEAAWWTTNPIEPQYIQRFWSFSSSLSTVNAIGMLSDDDYNPTNPYVFTPSTDVGLFTLGYEGLIKWVRYYAELDAKHYNETVDIEAIIDDILQNYLIDLPYKSQVELSNYSDIVKAGKMNVNIAGLKNVLTPDYEVMRKI